MEKAGARTGFGGQRELKVCRPAGDREPTVERTGHCGSDQAGVFSTGTGAPWTPWTSSVGMAFWVCLLSYVFMMGPSGPCNVSYDILSDVQILVIASRQASGGYAALLESKIKG